MRSMALCAIWSGVIGRYGDIDGVWIEPVMAQLMMTFFCWYKTGFLMESVMAKVTD